MAKQQLRLMAAVLFSVISVAHLVAQATDHSAASRVTQWLLMPLLAVVVLLSTRSPRPRLVRLLLVSIAFSWLGDSAPSLVDGDLSFLVMIGFFLIAQVVFVVAFWPFRRHSLPAAASAGRRLLTLVYLAALVSLVVLCAPGADGMLVPVVVYGAVLATMAVLATGVNALAASGGAVFVVSDSLIALNAFAPGYSVPGHDVWVMSTYILAQALIAAGVCRSAADSATTPLSPAEDEAHGDDEHGDRDRTIKPSPGRWTGEDRGE